MRKLLPLLLTLLALSIASCGGSAIAPEKLPPHVTELGGNNFLVGEGYASEANGLCSYLNDELEGDAKVKVTPEPSTGGLLVHCEASHI